MKTDFIKRAKKYIGNTLDTKIKTEKARFRTKGFLLDILLKSLDIEFNDEQKRKIHQRFVQEEKIGCEEYKDILELNISRIYQYFFDDKSTKINEQDFIATVKEFFFFYNTLVTEEETLNASQKQLDFIVCANVLLPLIALFFGKALQHKYFIDILLDTKNQDSHMKRMFDFAEGETKQNIKNAMKDYFNEQENDLGYDTINKNIDGWYKDIMPNDQYLQDIVQCLPTFELFPDHRTALQILKVTKLVQILTKRAQEYFGKELTSTLVDHFRYIVYLHDKQPSSKIDEEIFKNYYAYYINPNRLVAEELSNVSNVSNVSKKNNLQQIVQDQYCLEQDFFILKEKDFFQHLDLILPIQHFKTQLIINEYRPMLIDLVSDDSVDFLTQMDLDVLLSDKKTSNKEKNFLYCSKQYADKYDVVDDPYYSFLQARYFAQKREYKNSIEHYKIALEYGKNTLGRHLKSIVREGLVVAAQITTKQVSKLTGKDDFAKFYRQAYFYNLIEDLPEKISPHYLNDAKKQCHLYFKNLFPNTKLYDKEEAARNMGLIPTKSLGSVRINFKKPDKLIKAVYKNDMTQLMHCAFIGDVDNVRLLLEQGANASYQREIDNYTALIASLENLPPHNWKEEPHKDKHIEIAKLLILKMSKEALNAKLVKKQETALSYAIQSGLFEVVKLLVEHGVDLVSKATLNELTPLYLSIQSLPLDRKEHRKRFPPHNPLMEKDSLKKIRDVYLAPNALLDEDKQKVVEHIQQDPSLQSTQKILSETMLSMQYEFALQNQDSIYSIFDLLLKACPESINIACHNGFTPLIFATEKNDERLVKALLENGANPDHYTLHNNNAYEYAQKNQNETIMEMLSDY